MCFAHALIIAIAQVNGDPKYAFYRQGKCIKNLLKIVWRLLALIYLMPESLKKLISFNSTFRTIIVVFNGLNPDRAMFSGNALSGNKLYLPYNAEINHYSVITNIKAAMAKRYFGTRVLL